MAQDLGNGSGNGNGEERTPQGSFDLPVRVTRVESMLRGAENGSGSGNGNGRTPQGSFDLPVRVTQVEDMSLIPGNANGTGNGNGNETGSGSGTGEEAEVEQMALGESAEQSPAESLNLPLRITRLESILSGRSTGEQIRSPSDSFDLPERVAVEGTIGLLSPGTAEAGQATGAPALLADQANDVPALVGDQAIDSPALVGLQATDSPALVGDQEENALKSTGEAKNGLQTTALSTRFDSASSTGSFDLPARVSRLESMLTGRDVRVSSFELPRRVEMEGVSAGAMNGMNGDGTIPEQAQIGVSSEENGLGETDLAGHGPHLEGWEHQKRSQSSGREFAESDETLETYRQALVELPALMFEVALLRRQLAGRQQRDVRLTSADCSGNESEEHPNRRALEALVARLREELAMGRKRDADVAIVKEELLSLRAELADREAALVAAAEALRASRIQGLEGLGTSIMHRLSLTVSEPAAGRSEPEEEFGARVGREGKPRAKSETSAALPPMILGLRRASLRGLEVLAWEAIAAERLRSASAPATLQRSAVRADGTDRRRHFDDVIPERLPIQPTEEDESERVTEESEESPFREAPVRKARSEPLALQMDHVSFVDDSVEQELRDQVFSLTSLLSARERAHEEVPALRREVARLERALKQQATESAAARAELEREVSRLRGALEECEARCEVLRAEVLEVTRTRVESAAAGRADELWMVVPRAAAGSEGEEALRQQVQHLQVRAASGFVCEYGFCGRSAVLIL